MSLTVPLQKRTKTNIKIQKCEHAATINAILTVYSMNESETLKINKINMKLLK